MTPSPLSDASRSFLSGLAEDVKSGAAKPREQPSANVDAYLQAAAVQHVFAIADLKPARETPPVSPAALLDLSTPAPGFLTQRGRSLLDETRSAALDAIGNPKTALEILDRNPDRIKTPTQRLFEALLRGSDVQLSKLSASELRALQTASEWARRLSANRFAPREIAVALENAEAVASFPILPPDSFVGREDAIDTIRTFAGMLESGLFTRFKRWVTGADRVLVIEGVGGIGKTATLGEFLGRYRNDERGPRFPFAYLPCDNSGLDLRRPETFLGEAARQFARLVRLQTGLVDAPIVKSQFEDAFIQLTRNLSSRGELLTAATSRRSKFASQEARVSSTRDSLTELVSNFARLATAASNALRRPGEDRPPPALLIIDTYEEAEYQAREALSSFHQCLAQVLEGSVECKLIVAGRAPISDLNLGFSETRETLIELDTNAATDLLVKLTKLPRPEVEPVARQIGGNPLNLQLAARLADRGVAEAHLGDVRTTRLLGLRRMAPELIAGQLYRRVLERIHNDNVRILANPGMLLRRVTPDIIRQVLAPICKLGSLSDEDARQLFSDLMQEHTLVRLDDDQSLRYREDVRSAILRLLTWDEPDLTRRVHEAAIRFYRSKTDPVSVAEHVYHRLMLGGDTREIEAAWTSDAARYLQAAVEELPIEGKIWLAGRMSVRLPLDAWAAADTAAWERITGPQALSLLESHSSAAALGLLHARAERTPESPLFAIEARLLMSSEDAGAAAEVLAKALAGYPVMGNPGRRAELLWLSALIARLGSDPVRADAYLDELIALAPSLKSRLALVQALASRLRFAPQDWSGAAEAQQTLVNALLDLTPDERHREAAVVRTAYARLPLDIAPAARQVLIEVGSSIATELLQWKPTPQMNEIIGKLHTFFRSENARLPATRFTEQLAAVFAGPQILKSDLLRLLELALTAIGPGGKDAVESIYAAKLVWWVLQCEPGDLSAATLAGIEEYRADWELAGPAVAMA